jgi:hypothetical protein
VAAQKIMKLIWAMTFLSISFFLSACSTTVFEKKDHTVSEKLYKLPENCSFTAISGGTQENECSPVLLDPYFSTFSGLVINGPTEVIWPKDVSPEDFFPSPSGITNGPLRLMVAGLARVQHHALGLKGDAGAEVLIVAVNEKTAQTYSGKMPKPDSEAIVGFEPVEIALSEADRNALLTSHFNLDLVHDVELPIANATYTVYATLGELKSNVLTIKTTIK